MSEANEWDYGKIYILFWESDWRSENILFIFSSRCHNNIIVFARGFLILKVFLQKLCPNLVKLPYIALKNMYLIQIYSFDTIFLVGLRGLVAACESHMWEVPGSISGSDISFSSHLWALTDAYFVWSSSEKIKDLWFSLELQRENKDFVNSLVAK